MPRPPGGTGPDHSGRPPGEPSGDLLFGGEPALVLVDGAGRVAGWSPGATRLLGYRPGDVVGTPVARLVVPPPDPAAPGDADDGPLPASGRIDRGRAGEPRSWLLDVAHRDGGVLHVVWEGTPLAGGAAAPQWLLSATGLGAAGREAEAGGTRADGTQAGGTRAGGTAAGPSEVAPPGAAAPPPPVQRSLLRALMEGSPIALTVWDADLRCVWRNTVSAEQTGPLSARRQGTPFQEAVRGFDLGVVEPLMRGVLETGEPVVDQEVTRIAPDGEERAFSASMFRLEGLDGTPLGVCTIGIDVGDSKARQRLRLLSSAGTRVGTSLAIMTTAQELCDVAVPQLADFATVDLADWVPLGEVPRERPGASAFGRPAFRRAGVASVREGAPEAVFAPGEVVHQPPTSPIVRPLLTGESVLEPHLDTAEYWLREDRARARVMANAGMHSTMAVPLKARGAILGVATFRRTENPAPFTRDDLLLAEELAARAALSLDNARRYARERSTALALQRDLLPQRLPAGEGLQVATRYLPADAHERVGGDWYDVVPLAAGRTALVVGDVVGHGVNAAAAMGRLRTALHTLARQGRPPHLLLADLDEVALRLSEEMPHREETGVPALAATCLYAVYDPATRTCTVARAGHPPPAVLTPEGGVAFLDPPAGGPVGWGLATYSSVDVHLPAGSLVALYTDGLVETRRQDIDTGLARLAAVLREVRERGEGLEAGCTRVVETMTDGATPQDDIALLLARTRSGPGLLPSAAARPAGGAPGGERPGELLR